MLSTANGLSSLAMSGFQAGEDSTAGVREEREGDVLDLGTLMPTARRHPPLKRPRLITDVIFRGLGRWTEQM